MSEKFNDTKLIEMARGIYYGRGKEPSTEVRKLLGSKEALTNEQRNLILDFVEANAFAGPISILQMKREILSAIGSSVENQYGTLSRREVQAIYEWFVRKGFKNGTKGNTGA